MSQFYTDTENPHLGGYCLGGDEATYYPDLWRWLVEERGVRSVIDVGCGEGHAFQFFEGLLGRLNVTGIDGIPQEHPMIEQHDYTTGPYIPWGYEEEKADLVWSCEFVEHVEERYVPNFLETFRCADLVLMTHAEPGQLGHHHVNCQPDSYWIGAMAAIGYRLDQKLTDRARQLAALNRNPYNHFARSGLAFSAVFPAP